VQDEISLLADRIVVTLGSQVQWDSYAGGGLQPTARVLWRFRPHERLWAATSRALRTPALIDRGIQANLPARLTPDGLPLLVTVVGNPMAKTENFRDGEVGYRCGIGSATTVDITAFQGHYDDLQTQEPSAPTVAFLPTPTVLVTQQFGNLLAATTRGVEVAGRWAPTPVWHVDASYTRFDLTPHLAVTSLDPNAAHEDGSAPRHQWQVRSTFTPNTRATFRVAVFRVGQLQQFGVPAYTRVDANVEWRFTPQLSLMAIGQNLLDPSHPEFSGVNSLLTATHVPRSGSLRLTWTF
jgi:iron complex outermembrane receptor protein